MRGLSGAVTALILVVASVVIALIVVGFAFNLFGTFGSAGAVSPVGPAYISVGVAPPNVKAPPNNDWVYLEVTIDNRGPQVAITSATINGQILYQKQIFVYTVASNGDISGIGTGYIPAGENTLLLIFNMSSPSSAASINGTLVNVQLNLANGQTVYIAATPVY